jgi:ubiquinone/menaquinone biosynthesis C-methylase UbiE
MGKSVKSRFVNNRLALRLFSIYRAIKLRNGKKAFYVEKIIHENSNSYVICRFNVFSKSKVGEIKFMLNGKEKAFSLTETRDFQHKYPGFTEYCINAGIIGFEELQSENTVELSLTIDGQTHFISERLKVLQSDIEDLKTIKSAKLRRVKDILTCPLTKEDLVEGDSFFEGEFSHRRYQKNDLHYNFLPDDLAEKFNIMPTLNISAHDNSRYEEQIIEELLSRGVDNPIILDCGAGLKPRYRAEVVNFEIVAYTTTDVIGINEKLPFKDSSFDAVLSAAVLEHVKDPFQSAKEIMRVLKPGGILMAFVPFLQPYHGYPHHYYNMTISGIRNLFEESVEIKELGTNLHPLDLLPWYINSYISSLNPGDKAEFLNTKLKKFRNLASLNNKGFYKNISKQTHEELAFVVKAIGYKKA